jgi:hypothetical protein
MQKTTIIRALVILFVPAIGFFLGLQFLPKIFDGIVLESSLVSTQTKSSEYLRPDWWSHGAQGELDFYGDWPRDLEKPRARMLITDSGSPIPKIPFADNSVETLRDVAMEDAQSHISDMQSPADKNCHEFSNTQIHRGTETRGDVSDLLTMTADCKNGDKNYIYYWRTTVDGSLKIRLIAFISERWIWDKNEKVFMKMIDSVGPINSAGRA